MIVDSVSFREKRFIEDIIVIDILIESQRTLIAQQMVDLKTCAHAVIIAYHLIDSQRIIHSIASSACNYLSLLPVVIDLIANVGIDMLIGSGFL